MINKTKSVAIIITVIFLITPIVVLEIDSFQSTRPSTFIARNPVRVALVGDSITQDSEYPSDLQSLLGSNYSVGNFGSRGSTVLLNSWKPYMNQSEFQDAQNFQPDIVVVMLGTNDDLKSLQPYNESFEADYSTLICSFQQLDSNPQILIAESPPIFNDSADLSPAYLTNTIIQQTDDLANQLNLPIINVYDAFGNHTDYFVDGIHPNGEGAAVIASEVYDAINAQNTITLSS